MGNMEICDSPDLWSRMKTAKEILRTEGFSSKYRSPPSSPIEETTKISSKIKPETEVTEQFEVRAMAVSVPDLEASFPQDQTPELEDPNPARGSTVMSADSTVKGASHSPAMKPNEASRNPRTPTLTPVPSFPHPSKQTTIAKQRYYPVIPLTPEEAIARAKGASNSHNRELLATNHREVPKIVAPDHTPTPRPSCASVASQETQEPPQVSSKSHLTTVLPKRVTPVTPLVRNGTPLRLRARSPKPLAPQKQKSPVPHAPHIPSPLAKEITVTSSTAPNEAPEIENRPQISFIFADTPETGMMSTSNSSDTVLMPPAGGYRKGRALSHQSMEIERTPAAQPFPSPDSIDFDTSSEESHPSHYEHEVWQKGVTIPKENRRDYLLGAEEDVHEELQRLQKAALVKAFRGGQRNSEETASPELLARCRDGPGTDILSPIYQHLEKARLVPQEDTPDYSNLPGTSYVFSAEEIDTEKDPKVLQSELETQVEVWRELYNKTPRTYPSVSDKKLTLFPAADDCHKRALARVRKSLAKIKDLNSSSKSETTVTKRSKRIVQEHAWSDKFIANWEYCPHGISDAKWYRARFQSWLDGNIPRECYVDIFHEAYFQGTAHADGETSMFILDMRKYKSTIHPSDKQGWNHAHESAAGYIYNIIAQKKKAEEEDHRRKEMDRKVRRDALHSPRLRSPSSPVANIYLRPAEEKDAPGLEEIIDWYAKNSSRSPNTNTRTNIDSEQVLQRIRGCREAQLPFIVAVDRHRSSSKRPENILGYALAKEFDSDAYACHYTAELELFVKDGETNQGIGKCLLDRLLQACDPSHDSKGGYQFHASTDDRSAYYPGGRRRLARLVFTLSYVGNDSREIADHKRVKKWLEEHAGFEEQGLLWGVRVWGTKFLNVAYLVRSTGHNRPDTWDK
ncbi:hypothetical protein BJX68DRAFT_262756 [Aspergillus pseudodeflectus]|uniref:N-acetyltransferase domain-containing protein n=1 Tax=Aspergillus pseudodeflectus TaxID=176178 RepID=A0ABR4L108_9EURO